METQTVPAAKPKAMAVLPGTALGSHGAEYKRTHRHLDLDPMYSVEDVMRPGFWAHYWQVLRPRDILDVVSLDGKIDMQLRVMEAGVGYVKMRVLRETPADQWSVVEPPADEQHIEAPEGYTINFAPKHRWRVLLKGFADPISINHGSREAATAAAWSHSQKANAA